MYIQNEVGDANDFISNLKIKSQRNSGNSPRARVQTAPGYRPDHARKGLKGMQDANYNI
jgi:hypothetical protein